MNRAKKDTLLRLNKEYWENRTLLREVESEVKGLKISGEVLKVYDQALENIRKEINNIYSKYSDKTGLDVAEITRILDGVDRNKFVESIAVNMKRRGLKFEDYFDKGYIKRLTRLEALKQQIYWEIQGIAPEITEIERKGFEKMIRDSYRTAKTDLRNQTGGSTSFNDLDTKVVEKIMNSRWVNGNYSSRTFANIDNFALQARDIIGGGLSTGISLEKMSRQVRDAFGVAKYEATRLVRTETGYFHNQVELQSYKDEGVEYYRLLVVLDGRTSDICLDLAEDDRIYKTSEIEVGENYPPFHPNCRTVPEVVFPNELIGKEVLDLQENTDDSMFSEIYETSIQGLESQGWKRR